MNYWMHVSAGKPPYGKLVLGAFYVAEPPIYEICQLVEGVRSGEPVEMWCNERGFELHPPMHWAYIPDLPKIAGES